MERDPHCTFFVFLHKLLFMLCKMTLGLLHPKWSYSKTLLGFVMILWSSCSLPPTHTVLFLFTCRTCLLLATTDSCPFTVPPTFFFLAISMPYHFTIMIFKITVAVAKTQLVSSGIMWQSQRLHPRSMTTLPIEVSKKSSWIHRKSDSSFYQPRQK